VTLRCGRFALPLDRPLVMGVVNVTPDSFSEGGRFPDAQAAVAHARRLLQDGADLIDIGGESTRPGAAPVAEREELERIIPVVQALRDSPVSVDTRRPGVMRAALAAGASMINDIQALRSPGAIEAVAESGCGICLMHMQGDPQTMQHAPRYDDVAVEVRKFLAERIAACEVAGISRNRLVADPGFGFGKTVAHNLTLLKRLPELAALGVPLLAGWSRKSSIGRITGREPGERLAGSLAAALLALLGGARILRVHDVRETRDAVLMFEAWRQA
jgi:dihydropteroate synthase